MKVITRRILYGSCMMLTIVALLAAMQQMPQTTRDRIVGTPKVTTERLTGTVTEVEGNTLAVKMSTGEIRLFNPPASRRFMIDGKELTVSDLKPGTTLMAIVSTTETPVNERTTTIGTGKVWFVNGPNVIITLPNGENRMYKVTDTYSFKVDGQKATVNDLKKGMVISAEKVVEEPRTEFASDTTVTGHAPSGAAR